MKYFGILRTPELDLETVLNHFNIVENNYSASAIQDMAVQARLLHDLLAKIPLKNMPLYINDEDRFVRTVAQWRLKIGK